jgi:hypothetical protein
VGFSRRARGAGSLAPRAGDRIAVDSLSG